MKEARIAKKQHDAKPKKTETKEEEAPSGIWNGTLSFSLVAIPVSLVRAVGSSRVSFRLLHRKDHSPLKRMMLCPQENRIVPPDEIIRGYEISPGRFIEITDDELESVTPERSRTIEIITFIELKNIDAIYYDHPYYLVPAKGGERAYALLVEIMHRTKKAGLARFVLREREYLAAVTSRHGALALIILHFASDIDSDQQVPSERKTEGDPEEIKRIRKMIEQMKTGFKPDKYSNEREGKILAFLEKKKKETTPVYAPDVEAQTDEGVIDLVAVLKKSMQKAKVNR